MSFGKIGNADSFACLVTWFTSIVSIVVGLDGFFLFQDHHLPSFKFECYRPVKAFSCESADESEGFFHWFETILGGWKDQRGLGVYRGPSGMGFGESEQAAKAGLRRFRLGPVLGGRSTYGGILHLGCLITGYDPWKLENVTEEGEREEEGES
jgi:hypothetical protein